MQNELYNSYPQSKYQATEKAQSKFMSKVYAWMLAGLGITAITSFLTVSSGLYKLLLGNTILLFLIIIAEFGLVVYLSARINKMKLTTAILSFMAYAGLTGITFSALLSIYSTNAIVTAFGISAGMFASLSLFGFVTKKNLSGWGNFLFMGLVGLVLMSILSLFVQSNLLWFIYNIVGIIVFAGLTAYDTQKIKEMFYLQFEDSQVASKGAIIGSLKLYLDFINLFLIILRLVGGSRD